MEHRLLNRKDSLEQQQGVHLANRHQHISQRTSFHQSEDELRGLETKGQRNATQTDFIHYCFNVHSCPRPPPVLRQLPTRIDRNTRDAPITENKNFYFEITNSFLFRYLQMKTIKCIKKTKKRPLFFLHSCSPL